MTPLGALDLILKIVLFGWFGYARRHFATAGKRPVGMILVQIAYLAGLGVNLWLIYVRPAPQMLLTVFGLLLTLASAGVFYAAVKASKEAGLHVVFSEATGTSLISGGIYAHVRHPFYLAYLIYWLSWSVSVRFAPLSLLVVLGLLVLYIFSMRLEERQLAQKFGEQYRAYRKRTALLIPYIL